MMWRFIFRHMFCRHVFRMVYIEWDGTTCCECEKCGKQKRVPL